MNDFMGHQIGHYRLVRELGTGGFADVYLAEHIYLNRPAAIKLLHTSLASGDRHSFHDEAKTIAQLEHPHIVHVLDFGIEKNVPYLVMDYAPNGTLRQRHPTGTRVPLALIVMYVKQLASALQYAHTRRLIHRDIKPENVLLGRNDELLLGDFGAALLSRTSVLGTQKIVGTPPYIAPEQLRGRPVVASDQYALGIIVYEWLCGENPFQGLTIQARYLHQYNSPPPLHVKLPTISASIEQVVMKAVAEQPEQRFATIQEFADALERVSQMQAGPLVLPRTVYSQQTEAQVSPTMFIPPAPLPATVIYDTNKVAHPRYSRRALLGLSVGLAVVGSGCGLALLFVRDKPLGVTKPRALPTPTSILTKNKALIVYREHKDSVFSAAWSPDGKYIASAGGATTGPREGDTSIRVWVALGNREVSVHEGHSNVVRIVAWSPVDGEFIASASEDGTVKVWGATNGNAPFTYKGHANKVMSLAWSPDGNYIVSADLDFRIYVWNATDGTLKAFYDSSVKHVPGDRSVLPTVSPTGGTLAPSTSNIGVVTPVAWSGKGDMVASVSKNMLGINVWNAWTGETLFTLSSSTATKTIGALTWSPDSRYIVTGHYDDEYSVRIWDINTGQATPILPGIATDQVYSVAYSPNGKYIAAAYNHAQVKVWDCAAKKHVLTYLGHDQPVISVQWSPNSQYIASCGFDGTVQIWEPFA